MLFDQNACMNVSISEQQEKYLESLSGLREASPFLRKPKLERLLSQVDVLSRSREGLDIIYEHLPALLETQPFKDTVWDTPAHLVPGLVGGTLLAGHPTSTTELLSELRMIAIAEGRWTRQDFRPEQATGFLQDVLVSNFQLAFEDFSAESWDSYTKGELTKVQCLFAFLRKHISLQNLVDKLYQEVDTLVAHRSIATDKLEMMLRVINDEIQLDQQKEPDRQLRRYLQAFFAPTENTQQLESTDDYAALLPRFNQREMEWECRKLGEQMWETGLVSTFHVAMIRYLAREQPSFLPRLLHLDAHGQAEFERHQSFVLMLIQEFIIPANRQAMYGLSRILQRNLFSRPITWNAFNRLLRIDIHPEIAGDLIKSNHSGQPATPLQLLVGGAINVLGHPLGVRQGNNPTCASARGISMWSRHAPGKLINLLIDAATANNIAFRYEGQLIESADLQEGLVRRFDYKLDPVSVVLVQHLDKIYNAMMQRATIKHPGEDPHISVNPAFYGHWIQTGFISVYNPVTGAVENYEDFVRIFYASFHPEYNGGHHLIYPVPLGIFITNAAAEMTGYHAVSLLRVEEDPSGKWRAYFFNPNSEGRQNWGQGIHPSVTGRGERHGESSLPVHKFLSRVYAYHFNKIQLGDKPDAIPRAVVREVVELSRNSWGKKYQWV